MARVLRYLLGADLQRSPQGRLGRRGRPGSRQETVIGVAKNIGEFEADAQRGSFKGWLLRQTSWRIADRFRAKRRGGAEPESPGPCRFNPDGSDTATRTAAICRIPDPASTNVGSLWDAEWERHLTRIALERVKARVSVKQFQMFDLHVLQELPVRMAAQTIGVSVPSVYMAKARVGRLLRNEVSKLVRGSTR